MNKTDKVRLKKLVKATSLEYTPLLYLIWKLFKNWAQSRERFRGRHASFEYHNNNNNNNYNSYITELSVGLGLGMALYTNLLIEYHKTYEIGTIINSIYV